MANAYIVAPTVAQAMCDALTALFNAGPGGGLIKIFAGTKPAGPSVIHSESILATLTYSLTLIRRPCLVAAQLRRPPIRSRMKRAPMPGRLLGFGRETIHSPTPARESLTARWERPVAGLIWS